MTQEELNTKLIKINDLLDELLNHFNMVDSEAPTQNQLKQIDLNAHKATTLQKWARL